MITSIKTYVMVFYIVSLFNNSPQVSYNPLLVSAQHCRKLDCCCGDCAYLGAPGMAYGDTSNTINGLKYLERLYNRLYSI